MDDLISRAAAIDAVKKMRLCASPLRMVWDIDPLDVIAHIPAVDAIPVEWLHKLMTAENDDVDKVEYAWIMREWGKERGRNDGKTD